MKLSKKHKEISDQWNKKGINPKKPHIDYDGVAWGMWSSNNNKRNVAAFNFVKKLNAP